MKSLIIFLIFHQILFVATEVDDQTASQKLLCSFCQNAAGYIRKHSESIERMAKLPCIFMSDSKACDGSIKILVTALDVSGEDKICQMIKMCSYVEETASSKAPAFSQIIESFMDGLNGNIKPPAPFVPIDFQANFKTDSNDMKKAANKAFEAIGGTISNIGSLTNEGSEQLGKTFGNIPVAGQLVEKATKGFGSTVEKLTNGIDDIFGKIGGLFGSIGRSPMRRKQLNENVAGRFRRSPSEDMDNIRNYLSFVKTEVSNEASQVERDISTFASNVKTILHMLRSIGEYENSDDLSLSNGIAVDTNPQDIPKPVNEEYRSFEDSEMSDDDDDNIDEDDNGEAEEEADEDENIQNFHPKNPSKTQNI